MAETYCGKFCADCVHKEQLNCLGCKNGPGRQFGGDCELAKCLRDKGHETCDTCIFKGNCGTLKSRYHMPEYRLKRIESEQMSKAAIAKRAPVLGKWLWILFWLVIPIEITGLISNEKIVVFFPGLFYIAHLLNTACAVVYGVILMKLGSEEERYRTAGICMLVTGCVSGFTALLNGPGDAAVWTLIFTIPAAIVAMVGEYNQYLGHSTVLTGVNNELSDKWTVLWKWYIGLYLGMFGCILLILIVPFLGAVAIFAIAIGIAVVSVLKLVYLYRTAKIFRDLSHRSMIST